MNKVEARQFAVDEICTRWPQWKATTKLIDDFADTLQMVSREYAFNAVKKLRSENNFNNPDIGKLEKYCIEQTKKRIAGISAPVTAVFYGSGFRVTMWVKVFGSDNIDYIAKRDCEEVLKKNEFSKWGDNYILFIGEENQHNAIRKSIEIKGLSFSPSTVKNFAAVINKKYSMDEIPETDRREMISEQATQLLALEKETKAREFVDSLTDADIPF